MLAVRASVVAVVDIASVCSGICSYVVTTDSYKLITNRYQFLLKGGSVMSVSFYLAVDCRMCNEFSHIPMTEEQEAELNKPRAERMFMQDIFPELSVGDRELLISGTCSKCWDKLFPEDDE